MFKRIKSVLSLCCLIAPALFLIGCQPARMMVPPDLRMHSHLYPCQGRQGFKLSEQFSCGPYAVMDVRRGWTRSHSWTIGRFRSAQARQNYEYRVVGPGGVVWYGQAATGVTKNDIRADVLGGELMWGLTYDMHFFVRIGTVSHVDRAWSLIMSQGAANKLVSGVLTDNETMYRVEGVDRLEGTPMPLMEASGYLFALDGVYVAAVEVINDGQLRFSTLLNEFQSDLIAAASAGLLLYRNIGEW